jgi:hypothetical protein
MMPYSKLTGALLALDVRPGTFQLQLTASQTNETESGSMAPAAAALWSGHGHLLSPPWFDMSSVLENWEDEYGQLPQEGSPELDVDLDNGKRVFVRQGVEIVLPLELFRTLISRSTAFSTGVAGTSNAALSGIRHLESEAASIPGQYTRLDTERFGNKHVAQHPQPPRLVGCAGRIPLSCFFSHRRSPARGGITPAGRTRKARHRWARTCHNVPRQC